MEVNHEKAKWSGFMGILRRLVSERLSFVNLTIKTSKTQRAGGTRKHAEEAIIGGLLDWELRKNSVLFISLL
tara:strand:- start:7228 stop:7443 length:216 start_codon:yes stop_codon:yes gene_type:complete